jgi:2-methylisocitrate lyase-like PEP mutase family enzyme
MPTPSEKRAAFRRLHEQGCFVMPNPWAVGPAKYFASLGFKALASTSAGMAWAMGKADSEVDRADVLSHLKSLASATDLPLNADFENGFADDPEGVAENVRLAIDTGIAGLSIEDYPGTPDRPLYAIGLAAERIAAARAAIDASGEDVLLTGRAEGFIRGRPDLDETIKRLNAYADAGADCLYAPGITTREQIAAVVQAVAPKPFNLLIGTATGLTVADAAALGVRRISVGGSLARSAWGGFMRAAQAIAQEGRFDAFAQGAPSAELNGMFRKSARTS